MASYRYDGAIENRFERTNFKKGCKSCQENGSYDVYDRSLHLAGYCAHGEYNHLFRGCQTTGKRRSFELLPIVYVPVKYLIELMLRSSRELAFFET
jgi:hypothetical protein